MLLDQVPAARPHQQRRDLARRACIACLRGWLNSIVPRTASRRLIWPSMLFAQVGELASSKSAMKTLAPQLSALMIILRSTGPVISTRRSCRSAGDRRDGPLLGADLGRLGQKIGKAPGIDLAAAAPRARPAAPAAGDSNRRDILARNCKRLRRQDFGECAVTGPRISMPSLCSDWFSLVCRSRQDVGHGKPPGCNLVGSLNVSRTGENSGAELPIVVCGS